MKRLIKRVLGDRGTKVLRQLLGRQMTIPDSLMAAAAAAYRAHLDQGRLPSVHPLIIHMETRSLCNSRCGFCAAAVTNPGRPKDALMPDGLIDKVLAELGHIRYANRVSFYDNNEPFLDKRIFDIVARARRQVPEAFLEIKTNGLMLTADHVVRIFDAGLDALHINDYVTDGKPSARVAGLREIFAQWKREGRMVGDRLLSDRLTTSTRQVDAVLSTRAGTSPNNATLPEPLRLACFRPFEMMTINPAGLVAVCSSDVYFRNPMGNVNEESLMDIWNSPRWQEIRRRLLDGDRAAYPETCRDCDTHNPKLELMQLAGVPVPASFVRKARRLLSGRSGSLPGNSHPD